MPIPIRFPSGCHGQRHLSFFPPSLLKSRLWRFSLILTLVMLIPIHETLAAEYRHAPKNHQQSTIIPALPPHSLDALPCASFQWVAYGPFSKAAILVPVKLPGNPQTFWMQFDTGSPETVLYEPSFKALNLKIPRENVITLQIGLENFTVKFFRNHDLSYGTLERPIIGTLGVNVFARGILILDYPAKQICLLDNKHSLPTALKDAGIPIPLHFEDGRLIFRDFKLGDKTLDGIMFDTGSSAAQLILINPFDWQALTGKQLKDPTVSQITIEAWGQKAVVYKTVIPEPLRIETHDLTIRTELWTVPAFSSDDNIKFWKDKRIMGLTGNALFLNNILVIEPSSGLLRIFRHPPK